MELLVWVAELVAISMAIFWFALGPCVYPDFERSNRIVFDERPYGKALLMFWAAFVCELFAVSVGLILTQVCKPWGGR
ncbi:hypothetical protein PQU95_08820 [Vogesella sp. DC21W]|uniref:Uncharacterized protein n=1 Tax=Vogesella aquatica TaxID=2984206 RepID=A0ABT5IXN2_9NEIS|nr:hypothetical protein [Vogesella aquatica]MDC7717310.1 hypothetical protein [Vogesella aquatica]